MAKFTPAIVPWVHLGFGSKSEEGHLIVGGYGRAGFEDVTLIVPGLEQWWVSPYRVKLSLTVFEG